MKTCSALRVSLLFFVASQGFADDWIDSRIHLGNVNLDGSLREDIILGSIVVGNKIQTITLSHSLRDDPSGEVESVWSIPQLYTCLLPAGKGELRLVYPGGRRAFFSKDSPVEGYYYGDRFGLGFRLRSEDDGHSEILDTDGVCYRYQNGALQEIESPEGQRIFADTNGAHIRKLRTEKQSLLLQCEYDNLGRPKYLRVGAVEYCFEYSEQSGALDCINQPNGKALLRFHYNKSLLAEIVANPDISYRYQWEKAHTFSKQTYSRVEAPWKVIEARKNIYCLSAGSGATFLSCTLPDKTTTVLHFDWTTGRQKLTGTIELSPLRMDR